jgi:hypothetical protein
MSTGGKEPETKESKARNALHRLGLELADRWVTNFEQRPTEQLVLQKFIDPIVRHILNSIFPWIVGVAILFLLLLFSTMVTCYIVIRSGYTPSPVVEVAAAVLPAVLPGNFLSGVK